MPRVGRSASGPYQERQLHHVGECNLTYSWKMGSYASGLHSGGVGGYYHAAYPDDEFVITLWHRDTLSDQRLPVFAYLYPTSLYSETDS